MTTRKSGAAHDGRVTVDINDLTAAEIEAVEEVIDASIVSVFDPKARQGKAARALGWVMVRRTNPEFTLEEAGDLRVFFKTSNPNDEQGNATGS